MLDVGSLGDIGLIVRTSGLIGRIVQNGLNGFIDLGVSFISLGHVGFIGLGLVSIAGLIGHISLVGLGGLSGISGLVGRISDISLVGFIGLSLVSRLIGSSASSARRLIGLVGFTIRLSLATALIAAKTILLLWLQHAASHGVAALRISANEIANATISYHCAASLLHVYSLVREKMWWWLALAR